MGKKLNNQLCYKLHLKRATQYPCKSLSLWPAVVYLLLQWLTCVVQVPVTSFDAHPQGIKWLFFDTWRDKNSTVYKELIPYALHAAAFNFPPINILTTYSISAPAQEEENIPWFFFLVPFLSFFLLFFFLFLTNILTASHSSSVRVWGSWGIFFVTCQSQTSTYSTLSASKTPPTLLFRLTARFLLKNLSCIVKYWMEKSGCNWLNLMRLPKDVFF